MNIETRPPATLCEAVAYFSDEDRAHAFVVNMRWPDGEQACPHCGVVRAHYRIASRRLWRCREKLCARQFSVKVGTVFEDSALPLSKWLPAMWLVTNCKNGVSSYEVARAIGVSQKTAWHMLHRLRTAMQPRPGKPLRGTIEVDETFVGGKAKNMHKERRERTMEGCRGTYAKKGVLGLLRRGRNGKSRVRCQVTDGNLQIREAHTFVMDNVAMDARVHTDSASVFRNLWERYAHSVVDHSRGEYVRGSVHTQGIECFWNLLKRTIKGTYTNVAPQHLGRYLDEQARRFNERDLNDSERFASVLRTVAGRRLTYAALTGAGQERREA